MKFIYKIYLNISLRNTKKQYIFYLFYCNLLTEASYYRNMRMKGTTENSSLMKLWKLIVEPCEMTFPCGIMFLRFLYYLTGRTLFSQNFVMK